MHNRSTKKAPGFWRYCALQGSSWAMVAGIQGFMTTYMLSQGVPASQISLVTAGWLLAGFAGSIFWGAQIDRTGSHRGIFLLCLALSAGLSCVTYLLVPNVALAAVSHALCSSVTSPLATNLDAWVMESFPERPEATGRSRSWATASFATAMLAFGVLIKLLDYVVIPAGVLLLGAASAVLAWGIPDPVGFVRGERVRVGASDLVRLLRTPGYGLLVVIMFLTGMAVQPLNHLRNVILQSLGGDVAYQGIDSFVGCLVGVPALMAAGRFLKMGTGRCLALGATLPVLYAVISALAGSPQVATVGYAFNNASFGILFTAMRELTVRTVDPKLLNTANSVVDACYRNLPATMSLVAGGMLLDVVGVRGLCIACALVQGCAAALAVGGMVSGRLDGKAAQSAESTCSCA